MPIPEEMPIIAAAVLSHEGIVRWWLALPFCLLGVLSGDMVLYWVGRRHALKTVGTARHVMGLRAAAFLTAGSASVPFWKFVVADAGAALFGVPLVFGLAYFFTDQIKAIMAISPLDSLLVAPTYHERIRQVSAPVLGAPWGNLGAIPWEKPGRVAGERHAWAQP